MGDILPRTGFQVGSIKGMQSIQMWHRSQVYVPRCTGGNSYKIFQVLRDFKGFYVAEGFDGYLIISSILVQLVHIRWAAE